MFLASAYVISFLCLLFQSTRLVGVVGLLLISYLHPVLLIVLSALTGIYLYLNHSK